MKKNLAKFIVLLILILHCSTYYSYAQEFITPEDAGNYIGQYKTVCGNVASTYYAYKSKGKPTFINLNKPYPRHIFTIVIWESDRSKFAEPPELLYKDKKVCVSGKISIYKGKAQIIVRDSLQIK